MSNSYKCRECGYVSRGYMGKCPGCGTWSSLEKCSDSSVVENRAGKSKIKPNAKQLIKAPSSNSERVKTGIGEFDRLMGGGIVRDSVSILTARPGAGKSTLLLQIANKIAEQGMKVLYASGEESESQIKTRADRILEKISERLYVSSHSSVNTLKEEISILDADMVIVDSIQTFGIDEIQSRRGSPTQTMECANALVDLAKDITRPRMIFIVGQMTKEDELAGVRSLEHIVDTVLIIEGDYGEELRMLKSTKNRYGSTGEMGFFNMTEKGMESIDNPSEYFVTKRVKGEEVSGSALTVQREGTRSVVVEIEALVSQSFTPYPSRITGAMTKDDFNTIISIIEERAKKRLYDKNVVIKTTGGIRLNETSSTLATAMSIISALDDIPLERDTVYIADLGLTGELKKVPNLKQRVNELSRLGYKKVIVAKNSGLPEFVNDMKVCEIRHISEISGKGKRGNCGGLTEI